MQPNDEIGTNQDLCKYRLETAKSNLKCAKLIFEADEYRDANNRAYYAIFHTINAIHALDGVAFHKHKDAVGEFTKKYVKTNIFPREIGRSISQAEEIRHASDYDDFYIASKGETENLIAMAESFICMVEEYCKSRMEQHA